MNSRLHAVSAARKWGGTPEDYEPIEEFIDSSKQVIGDVRHRSLYHHTLGVYLCQKIFGSVLSVPRRDGRGFHEVPVRLIAERHIEEDLGWLPSPADYINGMPIHRWMSGPVRTTLTSTSLSADNPALASFVGALKPAPAARTQPHEGACVDH